MGSNHVSGAQCHKHTIQPTLAPTCQLHPAIPKDTRYPPAPYHSPEPKAQTLDAWHCTMSATRPREMLFQRRTHKKEAVVEGAVNSYMLHRVLYPQVHLNGPKKKKNGPKQVCQKHWSEEWAHLRVLAAFFWRNARPILLIPFYGPIIAAEKCRQWPQKGPVFLARNAVDVLGWAHYCCREMLPLAMNGPNVPSKKCCRCPWLGPLWLLNSPTDGHEWTQCFYQQMLQIHLHWSIIVTEDYS